MDYPTNNSVLFERRGSVVIATLNRPEVMNAVNGALWRALAESLEIFANDSALRVMVLTASGDRSFCAGTDLKAKAAGEMEIFENMSKWGYAGIVQHYVNKPVIAAVNGFALGGGTEIALSCDLIIASERATFGLPEVKIGLIAGAGGLLRLPRQIPLKVAMYHIMTGDPMTPQEAMHWGLINQVVPHSELLTAAIELALKISQNSPLAVSTSKEVVYRGLDAPLDFPSSAWELNEQFIRAIEKSHDAIEGPLAFAEKRRPIWKDH